MKPLLIFLFTLSQASYSLSQEQSLSEYKIVSSFEGVPAYSSMVTEEEENICGWISYDELLEVKKVPERNFYEVLTQNGSLIGCPQKVFVQTGFLIGAFSAGPKASRKTQRWKSKVPEFSTQCRKRNNANKIIVSFVGDILLHGALQRQAYSREDGFKSLWKNLNPSFQNADIAYANLEGPIARGITCRGKQTKSNKQQLGAECRKSSSSIYTSYPMFNYHPRLAKDLKESGFDILSTANNHSLDRWSIGANITIEELIAQDFNFTGTVRTTHNDDWYTITRARSKKGDFFNIAWIACTFSTNGIPDKKNQVMHCYKKGGRSNPELLELVSSLSQNQRIDGVIVTPHWGPTEYVHSVHSSQLSLGKELIDSGATAVIGAHPHVLQPWEVYKTQDGREGFIHYSLGNFVSNQKQAPRRASMVLLLGFQKTPQGKIAIDGVRYIPTYFNSWGKSRTLDPINKGVKQPGAAKESAKNIFSIFPDSLRLDSNRPLTSCK